MSIMDIVYGNQWNDLKYFYRDRNRKDKTKILIQIEILKRLKITKSKWISTKFEKTCVRNRILILLILNVTKVYRKFVSICISLWFLMLCRT